MPISPIAIASESISDEIGSSYSALLASSNAIRSHVTGRIREWELATTSVLDSRFPFLSQERGFSDWQSRLQSPAISESDLAKAVDGYMDFCKEIGHPANESFWRGQFKSKTPKTTIAQKLADDTSIGIRLLLNEWQKRMDQVRAEWELREIEARRAALMAELEKILHSLKGLQERLQELGLDTGLLLDLSKGNLTAQDIQQFERWAKYLAEDKGIRTLCELLGKIRQIELSEKIERVRSVTPVQAQLPDINSREEIIGISRYVTPPKKSSCEFSLSVSDSHTAHGIGTHLMLDLIAHAKENGLQEMLGYVLSKNLKMLHLVSDLGFQISNLESKMHQK